MKSAKRSGRNRRNRKRLRNLVAELATGAPDYFQPALDRMDGYRVFQPHLNRNARLEIADGQEDSDPPQEEIVREAYRILRRIDLRCAGEATEETREEEGSQEGPSDDRSPNGDGG